MADELAAVKVMLPSSINAQLERIMKQLGLRSKSVLIERLLREVFDEVEDDQTGEVD